MFSHSGFNQIQSQVHRRPCLDELHPPLHILVCCLFSFLLRSRKLPDNHHPFAFQDSLNAFTNLLKSLKTYGVDPSQVVVCGKSIGGTVAAVIIQKRSSSVLGASSDLCNPSGNQSPVATTSAEPKCSIPHQRHNDNLLS